MERQLSLIMLVIMRGSKMLIKEDFICEWLGHQWKKTVTVSDNYDIWICARCGKRIARAKKDADMKKGYIYAINRLVENN